MSEETRALVAGGGTLLPSETEWRTMGDARPCLALTPEHALTLMAGTLSPRRAALLARYSTPERWDAYLACFSRRFWAKTRAAGADDCWPWIGALAANGYGVISFAPLDVMLFAHRVASMMAGCIPARGEHVCHSCDVRYGRNDVTYRRCVNPAHLSAATGGDNTRHMIAVGRRPPGDHGPERNGRAVLDAPSVAAIKARLSAGEPQGVLAAAYGVRNAVMWRIAHGRTWAHI